MAVRALRTIRIEGNTAFVPLTKGYEAMIDASDVGLVEGYSWQAFVRRRKDGGYFPIYAMAYSLKNDGPRRRLLMHRVINPTPQGMVVDHINGDGLDNRRQNLRTVTQNQNMRNRRIRDDGAAYGVHQYEKGRWAIHWKMMGFRRYEDAVEARLQLNLFMESMNYPQRNVQHGENAVVHGRKRCPPT